MVPVFTGLLVMDIIMQEIQILIQTPIKSKQLSTRRPAPYANLVIIVPTLVGRSLFLALLATIALLVRYDLKNVMLGHTWTRQKQEHHKSVNLALQDIIVRHVEWKERQRLTKPAQTPMH